MAFRPLVIPAITASLIAGNVLPANSQGMSFRNVEIQPIKILNHSTTVLGQKYEFPAKEPVIYPFKAIMKRGTSTVWHKHGYPVIINIISGSLTVDYGSKGRITFRPGSHFVEAIDWCLRGSASEDEDVVMTATILAERAPGLAKGINQKCRGAQ